MKYRIFVILLIIFLSLPLIAGCTAQTDSSSSSGSSVSDAAYKKITAEEAKKIMDQNPDAVILDVRTEEEFSSGHIKGALLIPEYEISKKAADVLPDKSAVILVYCRSGRRSEIAANALVELGYTAVYDFGGIIDWPYDIVTE